MSPSSPRSLGVPGVRFDPLFAAVHIAAPFPEPIEGWHQGMSAMAGVLRQLKDSSRGGAVIVAGDFNTTAHMDEFHELLASGYRDAVDQSGAGPGPTFPANRRYPPFMAIDHVLTRDATALGVHSVKVTGSDHRGLLATVAVPADSTAS